MQIESIEDLLNHLPNPIYVGRRKHGQVEELAVTDFHLDDVGLGEYQFTIFLHTEYVRESVRGIGIIPYPDGDMNPFNRTFTTREEAEEFAGISRKKWVNLY